MASNNFDMVLFGATGDLAMRKLLPALYQAHAAQLLHPDARILGVSRSQLDTAAFVARVEQNAKTFISNQYDDVQWQTFLKRIQYLPLDVQQPEHFVELANVVNARTQTDNVIIYLSTSPQFFATTCEQLAKVGLNAPHVRIVLEKPLGTDLTSSQAINTHVARYFDEHNIYRIDHYLGKESLQNLLPLRFANVWLEPIWHRDFIKSVQITIAETLGVEERGEFYDQTGALRDMVQNHIIQMLCFVAMEQPLSLNADDIRNEKLKVVQALHIMDPKEVARFTVRGQYTAAHNMKAYREETRVAPNSQTETFVAIQTHINTPRWYGVPFYLRTGKRMANKTAEIVVDFKPVEHALFPQQPNRLVITLQPDETIQLQCSVKHIGAGLNTTSAVMSLDLRQTHTQRHAQAYELLLREVIDGRLALFNRRDELEAAWAWATPILDAWQNHHIPLYPYPAGSWGPDAAQALLAKNDTVWFENMALVHQE